MHSEYRRNNMVVIVAELSVTDTKEVPEEDMGRHANVYMEEAATTSPLVLIAERFVSGFVPNRACYVHTSIVLSMSLSIVLDFMKKWEEKKQCNMVHAQPRNDKKAKEVHVRAVTRGGAKTRAGFQVY
jgi:hypothetical protein